MAKKAKTANKQDTTLINNNARKREIKQLSNRIDNLSKSAGKKLFGISATDTALIVGATAAWGAYEKQMSQLQAQSSVAWIACCTSRSARCAQARRRSAVRSCGQRVSATAVSAPSSMMASAWSSAMLLASSFSVQ